MRADCLQTGLSSTIAGFMSNKLLALIAVSLTGCASQVEVRTVKVPVPAQCQEPVPARPVMPTQQLEQPTIAEWVRAAMAELERREGYEGQLRTALNNCRAPIG